LARFEEEAKQVCRLSHPNTVQIYDFGVSEDGRMFIAMEYLRGINLSELLLVEGSVVYPRAVHIVRQVAASLDEAHALGLIHRDIKPLNVMLCRIGGSFDHVKVLDFGLVKQIGEDAGLKGDGATRNIQGTPLYMAPERLRKGAPVDQRSDIYSLGVLLYVLLSGRSPFSSEDELAVIQEILQGNTQPFRAASQQIPPELKLLTMRCLSIDPELRPQSAVEVIRELDGMDMPPWTPAMASAWWEGKPALLASADILLSSRQ
jgi:serine/threonine-protein kinase